MKNNWKKYYKNSKSHYWNEISNDFLLSMLEKYNIQGEYLLDIGSSTWKKLDLIIKTQRFKNLTWVEISREAQKQAPKCVRKKYVIGDFLQTHKLKHKLYDCVLDWSMLHCISPNYRKQYVGQIEKITKKGSYIIFRAFGHAWGKIISLSELWYVKYYFCNKEEIFSLYHNFIPLEISYNYPSHSQTSVYFIEILFQKK